MITNKVYKAGLGKNLTHLIYTILYAKLNNLDFYYTPLQNEHITISELEEIENFLGFKNIYPINSSLEPTEISSFINFIESNLHQVPLFFNIPYNIIEKTIAIHIRRDNDFDKKYYSEGPPRFLLNNRINRLSDKFYIELIKDIKIQFPEYKIHIYSQNLNLDNYKDINCIFHINTSFLSSFYGMLSSEILVIGFSALSYSIALLKDPKKVIYILNNYKPLKDWKIIKNKKF